MGQAGQEWHSANRGASRRTVQAILAQLR
jgi:hypothetical protein